MIPAERTVFWLVSCPLPYDPGGCPDIRIGVLKHTLLRPIRWCEMIQLLSHALSRSSVDLPRTP